MKDVQETNPTAEAEKLEDNGALNQLPEQEKEVAKQDMKLTKEEIISRLEELIEKSVEEAKEEVDLLKQNYYKLRKAEIEELQKLNDAETETVKASVAEADPTEEKLKNLLNTFKEKRAAFLQQQDKIKEENLTRKKQLLEDIRILTEDSDNINKHYNQFQQLQQAFKEITNIPQVNVNDLWKTYQLYVEQFYDMLKINKELRDYDFKKNLDLKTAICDSAEALTKDDDVVAAFRSLQQLHDEWRAAGPVAQELRDELWDRFKDASTIINKRHQQFFETIKEEEKKNEDAKIAICEIIEAINTNELKSFNAWEEKTKEIIAQQENWKKLGFAARKINNQLFERFRKVCDEFFKQKAEYFKSVKETMNLNLEKKKALCEKVEALKDNTDWKSTAETLIAIQKEWKTIGSVSKKQSDIIWKRFITACDYFFEQKEKHTSTQRQDEAENLRLKKEIIEKLNTLDETIPAPEAIKQVKEWMAAWNKIGYVPFKEKDKIYKEYQTALDKHFGRLNMHETKSRLQSFSSSLQHISSGEQAQNKLYREREKLMRAYEHTKSELQTYENNMGFLTLASKSGEGMLKEMERKMQKLKEEMDLIAKKIDLIDQNL